MKKGMIAVMTTHRWGPLGHTVVITHDRGEYLYERAEFASQYDFRKSPIMTQLLFTDEELELVRGVRV